MRALLDVNMLLALFDSQHTHHAPAARWRAVHREMGWASCALTGNGFVRIITGPSYPRPTSLTEAVRVLAAQMAFSEHVFWADDISITDPGVFDHGRILGPNQITDVYLLALAVKNGGRLVTFDRGLPIAAVRGAGKQHVVSL
jgi:toxin-antitoxin system PIN domain toxin